jgi:hypothetical protein
MKVKKALELQAKGNGIQLFREADFLSALNLNGTGYK